LHLPASDAAAGGDSCLYFYRCLVGRQRTERFAPKDRNIAETEPARFAQQLIDRLDKVLEEREAVAKVEERLRILKQVRQQFLKKVICFETRTPFNAVQILKKILVLKQVH
jgi:signal transduction histidine kinase